MAVQKNAGQLIEIKKKPIREPFASVDTANLERVDAFTPPGTDTDSMAAASPRYAYAGRPGIMKPPPGP